jgi:hypothetical protein
MLHFYHRHVFRAHHHRNASRLAPYQSPKLGVVMIQLPSEHLAAIEARMTAAAPIVLKATAEVPDDAGGLPDGDVEESSPDGLPVRSRLTK